MVDLLKAIARKPRRLSKADKAALNRAAMDQLISEIQEMESRAHDLGMHVTGHALNRAKNAAGWEVAGEVDQAAKAAFRLAQP